MTLNTLWQPTPNAQWMQTAQDMGKPRNGRHSSYRSTAPPLTHDVDESTKTRVFVTGALHAARVRKDLGENLPKLGPALDFGCGIGRVAFNLVSLSKRVACVDHSERVLTAAKYEWSLRHGSQPLEALRFVLATTDLLAAVQGRRFGLVHSVHTLQFMAPPLQSAYVEQLCDVLQPGGRGWLQLVIAFPSDPAPTEQTGWDASTPEPARKQHDSGAVEGFAAVETLSCSGGGGGGGGGGSTPGQLHSPQHQAERPEVMPLAEAREGFHAVLPHGAKPGVESGKIGTTATVGAARVRRLRPHPQVSDGGGWNPLREGIEGSVGSVGWATTNHALGVGHLARVLKARGCGFSVSDAGEEFKLAEPISQAAIDAREHVRRRSVIVLLHKRHDAHRD